MGIKETIDNMLETKDIVFNEESFMAMTATMSNKDVMETLQQFETTTGQETSKGRGFGIALSCLDEKGRIFCERVEIYFLMHRASQISAPYVIVQQGYDFVYEMCSKEKSKEIECVPTYGEGHAYILGKILYGYYMNKRVAFLWSEGPGPGEEDEDDGDELDADIPSAEVIFLHEQQEWKGQQQGATKEPLL